MGLESIIGSPHTLRVVLACHSEGRIGEESDVGEHSVPDASPLRLAQHDVFRAMELVR